MDTVSTELSGEYGIDGGVVAIVTDEAALSSMPVVFVNFYTQGHV
jgi:hypothetical protein